MYFYPIQPDRWHAGTGSRAGLPVSEYREESLRRERQEHLEESRFVEDGLRQWWLVEQGWLIDPAVDQSPFAHSLTDRLLQVVGEALISLGVWLTSRVRPMAGART